jgi:hypothetical protein
MQGNGAEESFEEEFRVLDQVQLFIQSELDCFSSLEIITDISRPW